MDIGNIISLITGFVGAIIGGSVTYYTAWYFRKEEDKQQDAHYASMIYYDLKSIGDYLKNESGSVNIRYSSEWQKVLSKCTFMETNDVEYIDFKTLNSTYEAILEKLENKQNKPQK